MTRFAYSIRGWLPVLVLPAIALGFWPDSWPRWLWMWTVAGSIYAGFKWLTWQRTSAPEASAGQNFAYLLLWPGMDAPTFLNAASTNSLKTPRWNEWLEAVARLFLGIILLKDVLGLFASMPAFAAAWSGMIGYMLVLHFGLFQLLSCFWRSRGIDARPLMDRPLHACSLADLWGRRWNTAFRDLMHRFIFKPLTPRLGAVLATWVGFGISGVIHDVVMSLPAGGGYGLPTLYFLTQAAGLIVERSRIGRRIGLGHGVRGWLFTMLVLIGPYPLLLHRPFLDNVVIPFVFVVRSLRCPTPPL